MDTKSQVSFLFGVLPFEICDIKLEPEDYNNENAYDVCICICYPCRIAIRIACRYSPYSNKQSPKLLNIRFFLAYSPLLFFLMLLHGSSGLVSASLSRLSQLIPLL